ncbi:MAG: hypothetical protein ACE37K_05375 [Planctomycetota bacterium]|jgi:hypothetical protein
MNARHTLTALPLLLLATACATPVAVETHGAEHELEAELRVFQDAQQVFREKNMGTHQFDFEGHGRVTVREILLEGFPGNGYLKCRFHYQNRTAKPVVQSWVSLDVLDAEGRIRSTQSCHLIMPTAGAIGRGSYYADELRTPTYNVHLKEGWTWRIRCESDLQQPEEPLDPPVKEPKTGANLRAPVIIRNRGQNDW